MNIGSSMWDMVPNVLFGESTGSLLVEVSPENKEKFLAKFQNLPLYSLGTVTTEPSLKANFHGFTALDASLSELIEAWNTPL